MQNTVAMGNIQSRHKEIGLKQHMRTLTTIALVSLLTACASQPAKTADESPANNTTSAEKNDRDVFKRDIPPQLPDIKAGRSHAIATGFTTSNGDLKPEVLAYAKEVAATRDVPFDTVSRLLKQAQYNAEAVRLMSPSKTRIRPSWVTYRDRNVEPVRLKKGSQFWQQHQSLLAQAEEEYGVPASIIVAIIGIETIFGDYTGNFSVLDVLTTLGFRYPDPTRPERSQMFRNQLADLFWLHHQGKLDATQVKGSFAGAMGLPQFMPTSLRRFAVDADNSGEIDLLNSPADAIFSVASFLRHHGWQPELPVFAPVTLSDAAKRLSTGSIDAELDWQTLVEKGARGRSENTDKTAWKSAKLGVVDLVDEPRKTVEYRTGTPNFFAITHYNRSYFYAASVADLASALAKRRGVPDHSE